MILFTVSPRIMTQEMHVRKVALMPDDFFNRKSCGIRATFRTCTSLSAPDSLAGIRKRLKTIGPYLIAIWKVNLNIHLIRF